MDRPTGSYFLAMLVFGTLAPFVRRIAVSSAELALYRAILGAALIGIYLLTTKKTLPRGSRREYLLLLLSGAAMGVNWILLFDTILRLKPHNLSGLICAKLRCRLCWASAQLHPPPCFAQIIPGNLCELLIKV